MIERQTIDGRGVTIAYLDPNMRPVAKDAASLVKLTFDDGENLWLVAPGAAMPTKPAQPFVPRPTRPPDVLLARRPSLDDADNEEAGWARHRERQRRPVFDRSLEAMNLERQVTAWKEAIGFLDASEVKLRDHIERDLAPFTGASAVPLHSVNMIMDRLMKKVARIRGGALKAGFRHIRSRMGNRKVMDLSLATWAQFFMREDLKGIDNAIRTGLIAGLDSTEIARKVVGSMGLDGVDGVTEFTRHKIAHLGRAAIKARRRASGETT